MKKDTAMEVDEPSTDTRDRGKGYALGSGIVFVMNLGSWFATDLDALKIGVALSGTIFGIFLLYWLLNPEEG